MDRIWVEVGGRRMHARSWTGAVPGTAPAVVLVHGLGVSGRYLVPTARELAPHCRVFAPDLPGFGRSERPGHALDVPDLAESLVRWMDAVGLGEAALLGNSLGCQVAVDCAARHPGRVTRLVLQGVTMDPAARSVLGQAVRLVIDVPREPLSLVWVVARDYLACGPRRLLATLRHGLRDRIEDKLPRVQAPALVVHGGRDPIVSREWSEEVARLLPHGRFVLAPRAAHAMNYAAGPALARLALPFLQGQSAAGRGRGATRSPRGPARAPLLRGG